MNEREKQALTSFAEFLERVLKCSDEEFAAVLAELRRMEAATDDTKTDDTNEAER